MKKILVVDDEPGIREVLSLALGSLYEVVSAANGQEALDLLVKNPPDLMLLDIDMPVISGLEVLRRLASSSQKYKVIMLTSSIELDMAQQSLALGALEYITKPFDITALKKIIAAKLDPGGPSSKDSGMPWKVKDETQE